MKTLLAAIAIAVSPLLSEAQSYPQLANQAFTLVRMIEKYHVEPRPLDDHFSQDLLGEFLSLTDPDKIYFTATDVQTLRSSWNSSLDDEIHQKKTTFLNQFVNLYQLRLRNTDSMITAGCKAKPAPAVRAAAKIADTGYAANLAAIGDKIRRSLGKGANCNSLHQQVNKILQHPAGIITATGNLFCKAIALCYDPHTEFFPKSEKENFDSELGQQPFRFGFRIKETESGIMIDNLEPGSPAYKSGQLNKGDKIVQVQWEGKQPVDVSAASIEELNEVLDMSNHDKMLLSVKKPDATVVQVPLIKEQLENGNDDDNKVKSFILKGSRPVGYIYLPAFYEDWASDAGVKGCANDVAKEIMKLKKENIEGLILDLRFNGGGSVQEAVELTGIFIDAGPVALIKTREAKPIQLNDINRGAVYNGPLVVLVNRMSASASEMVAGALQDYNRAIIAGTTTYGKATGQTVFPVDTTVTLENLENVQADSYVKITGSKLFRINGTTAQATGVVPSVILPDGLDGFVDREADEPFVLKSSRIEGNKYYRPYPALPAIPASVTDTTSSAPPLFTIINNQYEIPLLQSDVYLRQMNDAFKDALVKDRQVLVAYRIMMQYHSKQP